jgi:hypothetical protein
MCNKEANFWSGGVVEQYACIILNCVALVRQNFISSQGGLPRALFHHNRLPHVYALTQIETCHSKERHDASWLPRWLNLLIQYTEH